MVNTVRKLQEHVPHEILPAATARRVGTKEATSPWGKENVTNHGSSVKSPPNEFSD